MPLSRYLLLLALVALFAVARADEIDPVGDAEEENFDAEDASAGNLNQGVFARAFFENQDPTVTPRFVAGESAVAMIGFTTDPRTGGTHDLMFTEGFLNRVGDTNPANKIQGFGYVRYQRIVKNGETVTLRYKFTPHASLDAQDYNLGIRVVFRDAANQTFSVVAFNSTITIEEPAGIDTETVTTFLVIGAIIAGAVYLNKLRNPKKRSSKPTVAPASKKVESGTSDTSYDPDYVSKEHLQFVENMKRKSSASPNKKRN